MKKLATAGLVVTLLIATARAGDDAPKAAAAVKEHEWLQQFVGEWDSESEMVEEPGKPPIKCKGKESARMIGGFWMVAETKADIMNMKMTALLTVGYDPQKKKYVGTWIDSMYNHMWKYEGAVDATGKILVLETEGPNPSAAGKVAKFKETIEFKSKDHKIFTSSIQGEDGKWVTFLTAHYQRKK